MGCETLGMYSTGADLHYKCLSKNNTPDIGSYIGRFIENYFPDRDRFKKISKILSDYLRHSLVHGFAPRVDSYPFDINLYVSNGKKYLPPNSKEKDNRLTLEIDGVSFLAAIIKAFEKLKSEVGNNEDMANKFIKAEKYCLKVVPGKEILNQFIASFPILNKTKQS